MSNYVEGKVIVITGANGGFGRATSEKLAAMGAKVVMAARSSEKLDPIVAEIKAKGGDVVGVTASVNKREDVENMIKLAVDTYGRVDVLINNAGCMPLAPWYDHDAAIEKWEDCIDTNLKGNMYGVCAVYDQMIKQGGGHIVFISSIYSNYPAYGSGVYQSTKVGINYLADSLRQEAMGKIKTTIVRPTGVPSTGLATDILDREGAKGIYGRHWDIFMERSAQNKDGTYPPESREIDNIACWEITANEIADSIVYVVNQPAGVSISDITVRSSNNLYVI